MTTHLNYCIPCKKKLSLFSVLFTVCSQPYLTACVGTIQSIFDMPEFCLMNDCKIKPWTKILALLKLMQKYHSFCLICLLSPTDTYFTSPNLLPNSFKKDFTLTEQVRKKCVLNVT